MAEYKGIKGVKEIQDLLPAFQDKLRIEYSRQLLKLELENRDLKTAVSMLEQQLKNIRLGKL